MNCELDRIEIRIGKKINLAIYGSGVPRKTVRLVVRNPQFGSVKLGARKIQTVRRRQVVTRHEFPGLQRDCRSSNPLYLWKQDLKKQRNLRLYEFRVSRSRSLARGEPISRSLRKLVQQLVRGEGDYLGRCDCRYEPIRPLG